MVRPGPAHADAALVRRGADEGTSAPPLINGIAAGTRTDFRVVEATAGFRVNRDVTLRGSYYTRRFYGSTVWDQSGWRVRRVVSPLVVIKLPIAKC